MNIGASRHEPEPDRYLAGEIELVGGDGSNDGGQVLVTGRRHVQLDGYPGRVQHPLIRPSVLGREHRAQHLMSYQHVAQRRGERRSVQLSG